MILRFTFKSARLFLLSAGIGFTVVFGFTTTSGAASLPKVFYADPHALANAKKRFASNDPSLKPAFDKLIDEADRVLEAKPPSVMEKNRVPPSGDKHDFVSQAPYFWRETNADGVVKYVRHDGERNPESNLDSDAGRLGGVLSNVSTLGLAYYFTGNDKYAAKASEFLRVFFLNPATKMNPNLNFGQGVPGEVDGRPAGLIGARGFVDMMDALSLLERSKSWKRANRKEMSAWLEDYLKWLTTSKIGMGEMNAKNNHGSFCNAQAAAIALFLGKKDQARAIILQSTNRIAWQIKPDGSQPLELARTKSFGYSSFNLRALFDLASIGQNLKIDLWHFRGTNNAGIYNALAFMAPYADPQKKWPFEQIHGYNHSGLADLLLRGAPEFPDLAGNLKFYSVGELESSRARLLFRTAKFKPAPAVNSSSGANAPVEILDE
jgi:hypothetical protein